jgi:(p)ppGpp synthase/HD superfamily hydrolase
MRENGVRYFEHPKAIAVLLVRLGIRDAAVICAALLHDVVEDSFILLYADIGIYCCSHTQHLVRILTKDKLNGMTIHQYFDRLGNDTPESWIGKLGDRWHNLQTLVDSEDPIEHEKYRRKKLKQVMETREFIIPLARKLASLSKYRTLGFWLPLRKKWVARANYGDLGRWFERELTALCDQREAEAISEAVYM